MQTGFTSLFKAINAQTLMFSLIICIIFYVILVFNYYSFSRISYFSFYWVKCNLIVLISQFQTKCRGHFYSMKALVLTLFVESVCMLLLNGVLEREYSEHFELCWSCTDKHKRIKNSISLDDASEQYQNTLMFSHLSQESYRLPNLLLKIICFCLYFFHH